MFSHSRYTKQQRDENVHQSLVIEDLRRRNSQQAEDIISLGRKLADAKRQAADAKRQAAEANAARNRLREAAMRQATLLDDVWQRLDDARDEAMRRMDG